jgi:hypothetical protein
MLRQFAGVILRGIEHCDEYHLLLQMKWEKTSVSAAVVVMAVTSSCATTVASLSARPA